MLRATAPIVFCADANYGAYLPVAVQSIMEHSSPECFYHIIILDCGIGRDILNALQAQICARENFSVTVKPIDSWLNAHSDSFREEWYFTKAIYGRLSVPGLFPDCSQIIYADIDMIFRRDIAELMRIDLGDNYIAAVPDTLLEAERALGTRQYLSGQLGLAANEQYVNSGLIIFNADLWRKDGVLRKITEFLRSRKLFLPDQDALNAVCKGRILYLPPQWNCLSAAYINDCEAKARRKNKENTKFRQIIAEWRAAYDSSAAALHYIGPVKPWLNCASAEADIWWSYAARTQLYPRYLCLLAESASQMTMDEETTEYKFLGFIYWGVKTNLRRKTYLLCNKFRIAKKISERNRCNIYILGLKLFSAKREKAKFG